MQREKITRSAGCFGAHFSLTGAVALAIFLLVTITPPVLSAAREQQAAKSSGQQNQDFPPGPGRDTFLRVCSSCHSPANVIPNGQSREGWENTITKMVSLGATGSDEDFSDILDYLTKNFPPNSNTKLNVNKATAQQLQTRLGLTAKQAEAVVAWRSKNGDFKSYDDLKKVPELDGAKLDAQKDLIIFQ